METADPAGVPGTGDGRSGILYPLMLIAAIAVIVFSVAGIATMMGWMPGALSQVAKSAKARPASASRETGPGVGAGAVACAECGIVESIRAVEIKGGAGGAGAGPGVGQPDEEDMKSAVKYQIGVRMTDGTLRTHYERARPVFVIGQKVRATEQGIVAAR